MRSAVLLIVATALSCGTAEPPDPTPIPCEPGFSESFVLGVVELDNPRVFRGFADGCDTIEMQTGLQGGWHVEPALQAPSTAVKSTLGGRILWTVDDQDGNQVADGTFELFRTFWQNLEGGEAYWGDFVIFDRNPTALIGTELTINCELDFDEESDLDDVTLSHTVTLVDDDPTTVFE